MSSTHIVRQQSGSGLAMLDALNSRFALPDILHFEQGPGGLLFARVASTLCHGSICLHGGHVIHFQPRGQEPVLWLSRQSNYGAGKAIRGGIPVCWPWFGSYPDDPGKPAHGFARTSGWHVRQTNLSAEGNVLITLELHDSAETRALWPHRFQLELRASFGRMLHLSLVIHNLGTSPFVCTGALHSYFRVGDWQDIRLHGLAGFDYLDKTERFRRKKQQGPLTLDRETDRIYLACRDDCFIDDPVLGRILRVGKQGSGTTVVWNPGPLKAAAMADMEEGGHATMVCVESAMAGDADQVSLAPGQDHTLGLEVEIVPGKRSGGTQPHKEG